MMANQPRRGLGAWHRLDLAATAIAWSSSRSGSRRSSQPQGWRRVIGQLPEFLDCRRYLLAGLAPCRHLANFDFLPPSSSPRRPMLATARCNADSTAQLRRCRPRREADRQATSVPRRSRNWPVGGRGGGSLPRRVRLRGQPQCRILRPAAWRRRNTCERSRLPRQPGLPREQNEPVRRALGALCRPHRAASGASFPPAAGERIFQLRGEDFLKQLPALRPAWPDRATPWRNASGTFAAPPVAARAGVRFGVAGGAVGRAGCCVAGWGARGRHLVVVENAFSPAAIAAGQEHHRGEADAPRKAPATGTPPKRSTFFITHLVGLITPCRFQNFLFTGRGPS